MPEIPLNLVLKINFLNIIKEAGPLQMQLVFSVAPKHSPYLFRMARRETDPVRIYYYSHWSSFSNSPAGAFSRRSFLIGGLIRLVPVSYRRYLILKRFRDGLGTLTEQV